MVGQLDHSFYFSGFRKPVLSHHQAIIFFNWHGQDVGDGYSCFNNLNLCEISLLWRWRIDIAKTESTICQSCPIIQGVQKLLPPLKAVCEASLCLRLLRELHGCNEGEFLARVGHLGETGQLLRCGIHDEVFSKERVATETGESKVLTIYWILQDYLSVS
jgi:hypothetical protein